MQIVIRYADEPRPQLHSEQRIANVNSAFPQLQPKPPQKPTELNLHPSDELQVRERPQFQMLQINEEEGKKSGEKEAKQGEGWSANEKLGQAQMAQNHNYLISYERQSPHHPPKSDAVEASPPKTKQTNPSNKPLQQPPLPPLESASDAASETVNRAIGIILLFSMFGVLWIYGWASEYRIVSSTSTPVNLTRQPLFSTLFVVTSVFTVVGFGLLLMHFKRMTESAMVSSMVITSMTIIASPFLQKFWYNVLISDFGNSSISVSNSSYLLNQSLGGKDINIDFYNLKFSLINAISQLVVLLGLFGRINAFQTTLFSLLYNAAWNLNHYLLLTRLNSSPDARIFDDYHIASVYLFAGMFGLFSCLVLKKPAAGEGSTHSNISSMLAQVGTFFLFLSFCTNAMLFSQKTTNTADTRTYVWQEGFLNTFFALSASVLSSYLGSILLAGKIHVRESLLGTITGAIIFGSVAQVCNNIGAALATGSFSGLFSAFFYHRIYLPINRRRVFDSLGLILIAIVSLIGTLGVAPLVVYTYYKYNTLLPTLPNNTNTSGSAITSSQLVAYMIQYVGITAGVGSLSGILIGALMKIFDKFDADKVFDDKQLVSKSSGLKPPGQQKEKSESRVVSKSNKVDLRPSHLDPVQSQKEMNVA